MKQVLRVLRKQEDEEISRMYALERQTRGVIRAIGVDQKSNSGFGLLESLLDNIRSCLP